ncbi:MAG: hypothetical protein ACLR3O_05700 [Streptococcus sp.]
MFVWVQPFLHWKADKVHLAFRVSTSAVTDTPLSVSVLTDTAVNSSTVNHSEKQVVSVKEDGNITFPASVPLQLIFFEDC